MPAGKLKPIAVTSQKATDLLPGVKPVAEQGLPGFEVIAWNALYAPKGTPKEIVQALNAEINKILADPEARQKLKELGFDVGGGTAEALAEFGRSERQKWGPLITTRPRSRRSEPARRAGGLHAGAHITTWSGPSPSASQPAATIWSRTARSIM